MRNIEKIKKDQATGLFVKKQRAGAKGLTTTIINGAILRAMRRGRITKEAARRCMSSWDKDLVKRPQSLKWSIYASAQLLEVARYRQQGLLTYAKYTLDTVKNANRARMMA